MGESVLEGLGWVLLYGLCENLCYGGTAGSMACGHPLVGARAPAHWALGIRQCLFVMSSACVSVCACVCVCDLQVLCALHHKNCVCLHGCVLYLSDQGGGGGHDPQPRWVWHSVCRTSSPQSSMGTEARPAHKNTGVHPQRLFTSGLYRGSSKTTCAGPHPPYPKS